MSLIYEFKFITDYFTLRSTKRKFLFILKIIKYLSLKQCFEIILSIDNLLYVIKIKSNSM